MDRISQAQFRLLVAVGRADGHLDPTEIETIRVLLGPARQSALAELIAEDVDVDAELAVLDDGARRRLYQAAFALAYADGVAAVGEVNALEKIVPNDGERTLVGQVFGETLDTLVPGRITAVADPVQREMEIVEDTLKYATLAAVAGAMPVPGFGIVADVAVIALQTKLVHDIGQFWGHSMDRQAIRAFMGSAAGSAGLRIAVNNLARFVPGWGSLVGATTSFATTYALGMVAQRYFQAGQNLDEAELKSLFAELRPQGRATFDERQTQFETAKQAHGTALRELAERFESGAISRAEYDAAVASLDV